MRCVINIQRIETLARVRALSVANNWLPLPTGELARVAAYPSEASAHSLTEQQLDFRTLAQVRMRTQAGFKSFPKQESR